MHTIETLRYLVEQNHLYAYSMIFLITIIEGEVVAISAGILVLLGALNFWISLIAILCGAFIKTFLGYFIGYFLNKKFNKNKFLRYLERKVFAVMPHFDQRPFWSIFISKFIMMNHLVIIFAGYRKIDFKKYLQAEIPATLIWAPFMLALGYFFSYTAFRMSDRLNEFLLVVILLIVGFFIIDKVVSTLFNLFENLLHDHE